MPMKDPTTWVDEARAASTPHDAFKLAKSLVRDVKHTTGLSHKSVLVLKIVEAKLDAALALNEMQEELIELTEETKS